MEPIYGWTVEVLYVLIECLMSTLSEYQHRFPHLALERDPSGILEVRFHTNNDSFVWSGEASTEFAEAFHTIGNDPETKVLLFTGTGDHFCIASDDQSFSRLFSIDGWVEGYREGRKLIDGLMNIDIPIISAVNGPAHVHSELILCGDLILASEHTTFQDQGHFPSGVIPGDGIHALWLALLGPVRAKHFLLSGQELDAQEALRLGVVGNVLPSDQLISHAKELARQLASRPTHVLRYTKLALNQTLKRSLTNQAELGLALEGYSLIGLANI